ncbi:MAG: hypothetical protein U0587_05755 [Candidatus Binatia bacterium]
MMNRALLSLLLGLCGVLVGDIVFRASLLQQLRPTVLSPSDQAVVEPPVRVVWEGPRQMRVLLSIVGDAQRDLGVHESPFEIPSHQFVRNGGYGIELRALWLGNWIRALRWFQVHDTPAERRAPADAKDTRWETKDLLHALEIARAGREKAQERTRFLQEENAGLRDESERLATQLEALYKAQEDDAERSAELERRLAQMGEENRGLAEENAVARQRLASVIPCSVWGYVNFPRPQTVPPTRRLVTVSDTRGQVFRIQADCELVRHGDPTAASVCFCVGNSWGG